MGHIKVNERKSASFYAMLAVFLDIKYAKHKIYKKIDTEKHILNYIYL